MNTKDQIIENYKEQVALLKSINESNERIIDKHKDYQKSLETYIKLLKGQVDTLRTLLLR